MRNVSTIILAVIATGLACRSLVQAQVRLEVQSGPIPPEATFQVVDSSTMKPLAGVLVYPLCIRPNPYGTNIYHTDTNGWVKLPYYTNGSCSGTFAKGGYITTYVTIAPGANAVVALKRASKAP